MGGPQRANLLPAELCEILPNQSFKGKLTEEHTAKMIEVAARPPNANATSITTSGLTELGFRPGTSPQLNAFGVKIGNEMAVVPGRILPPPAIKYGVGNASIDKAKASWNMRDVKFAKGSRLADWAVLLIKDGNERDEFSGPADPELTTTLKGFAHMCGKSGMAVAGQPGVVMAQLPRKNNMDPTRAQAVGAIQAALKTLTKKPSIVLVILSNGDKHVYSGLKHLCDAYLDLGKSLSELFFLKKNLITCSDLPSSNCLRSLGQDSQR